jgi:hypothetical protein
MTEIANFWNDKHPLAAIATAKYDELVPGQGNCETFQGEMIRASGRISYDWYNNGWGCNNWSGAVQFIAQNFAKFPVQPAPEVVKDLIDSLKVVAEFSHGEPMYMADSRATALVTRIHEIVVQALIDNPEPIANTEDMFEYQEDDYVPEPEDEEEEEEEEFNDDEE